ALWMLAFLMPAEVRRYFIMPLLSILPRSTARATPVSSPDGSTQRACPDQGVRMPGLEEQALPRTVPLECSTLVLDDSIPQTEGQGLDPRTQGEEVTDIRADGPHGSQQLAQLPVDARKAGVAAVTSPSVATPAWRRERCMDQRCTCTATPAAVLMPHRC